MSDPEDMYEDEAQQEEDKFEDSSEEEEEDEDNYEQDDFIVDDVPDDDDDGPDEAGRPSFQRPGAIDPADEDKVARRKPRKRRRYREDSPELEEGDFQLLEEGGVRVDRRKKLKRLRKGASDEEDNPMDDVRGLADEDDEDDQYEERRRRADEPVDYDDEMDDFIDDGGRGRRRRAAERDGLVSSDAVRQARSLFGDMDDMTDYRGVQKLFQKGQLGEGGDDEDDADYVADGGAPAQRRPLRAIRARESDPLDNDDEDMPPASPEDQDEAIARQLGQPTDDTEEAKRIIETDVPEQLQYHFGPHHATPTEAQLKEEGAWIYKQGFENNILFADRDYYKPEAVRNKIVVVLSYIHIDKLDIPFIAMYRKDYITPFLIPAAGEVTRSEAPDPDREIRPMPQPRGFNSFAYDDFQPGTSFEHLRGVPRGYDDGFGDWSVLWHILDLDKRYAMMIKSRQTLQEATREATEKGVPPSVVEAVEVQAATCDDERELKDADTYIRLAIELAEALRKRNNTLPDFDDEADRRPKRPSRRRNRYADFCKRGYHSLAEEFGISAHNFGENVRGSAQYGHGMQLHVPLDADDEPIQVARVFAERLGETTERAGANPEKLAGRLLHSARFILTTEIVSELHVLKAARDILRKAGTVRITTIPTRQGIAQVDNTHPLRFVTSLGEKSFESFRNTTDFALVLHAVELGYTKLEVVLQQEQVDLFESILKNAFAVPEANSILVQRWNDERMAVVDEVLRILVARMKEEAKQELTLQTNAVLRNRLCQAASRRLLLGPGRPHPMDDGCPRVLAVCVTGEDDEDSDPLQEAKDAEDAKDRGQRVAERRVARERVTFVQLDENGEYQSGYELFAGWLRRPMRADPNRPDLPNRAELPKEVNEQLKAMISQSRAQLITIGIGSGGRSVMRLQSDLVDVVEEMVRERDADTEKAKRPLMISKKDMEAIHSFEKRSSDSRRVLSRYVVLADEFPARVYAKTGWANVGLSVDGMTLLEKRAIALGRLAQEPLWVYCAIGQEREAAVDFQLHPFHYFARPVDRLTALHRALFRAVCSNGVDINRMLRLPHTQPMLAFVGGLGIHKGKALLRALESALTEEDRGLQSRKHLWSENYLGRIVFLSTAAFLRVRDPELHPGGSTRRAVEVRRSKLSRKSRGRRRDEDAGGIFDPMDDSRIHPEHYAVAIKIADEALRDDEGNLRIEAGDTDEFNESLRMTAAVLDDPSGLERLALDEYAEHLEKLRRGSLFETVKIIAAEFRGPYKDYRRPLVTPHSQAVFYLVTGADPALVRIGSALTVTNCRIRETRRPDVDRRIIGISGDLPNGIRGFIPFQHFADQEVTDDNLRRLVPDGSSISCRVLEFEFPRFEATLTSRTSLIEDPTEITGYVSLLNTSDPAYRPYPQLPSEEPNLGHRLLNQNKKKKPPAPTDKRTNDAIQRTMSRLRKGAKPIVSHLSFKEISGNDATDHLASLVPGDVVIRPSQYSREGIVFSCKFASPGELKVPRGWGIFHKDAIVEYDSNDDNVALRLKVDGAVYEHVDQVLEQYLRPVISNMAECMNHRKFTHGTERELEAAVTSAKRKMPKSIPYCFGLAERRATSLILVYIPGCTTVQKEEIKVVPDGYVLRSVLHKNMEVLFVWFKKNMKSGNRRPAPKESIGASPFRAASPFQTGATSIASPFRPAASPFQAAKSPFLEPAKSPFLGAARARPAHDAPPPPAPPPAPLAEGAYRPVERPVDDHPPPRGPYITGGREPSISADDWAKATLQRDDPPPSNGPIGSYHRGPPPRSPPRRGDDMRGNGHRMPPRSRGDAIPPRGRGDAMAPRGRGDSMPPRGRGDPMPPRGRGEQGMPTWRGSKPVPAWKKKADEKLNQ